MNKNPNAGDTPEQDKGASSKSKQEGENTNRKGNPLEIMMEWFGRAWNFVIVAQNANAVIAIFTIALFFATTIYTVFAALQWVVTKQALHADQRAWIVAKLGTISLQAKDPISWPITYKNTGKTPAKNIHAVFKLEVIKVDDGPRFDYSPPLTAGADTGILFPDQSGPVMGVPVLQQVDSIKSMVPFDDNLKSKYTNREIVFMLHGQITYQDMDEVKHWVKFCDFSWSAPQSGLATNSSPAVEKCYEYNNVDNN